MNAFYWNKIVLNTIIWLRNVGFVTWKSWVQLSLISLARMFDEIKSKEWKHYASLDEKKWFRLIWIRTKIFSIPQPLSYILIVVSLLLPFAISIASVLTSYIPWFHQPWPFAAGTRHSTSTRANHLCFPSYSINKR